MKKILKKLKIFVIKHINQELIVKNNLNKQLMTLRNMTYKFHSQHKYRKQTILKCITRIFILIYIDLE